MYIDLTPEEANLLEDAEAYFSTVMSKEDREGMKEDEFGDAFRRVSRRLGADGWLGRGWPPEYGGEGLGAVAEQLIISTMYRYHVPSPHATVFAVGLSLQHFGTEQQRAFFLPKIRAGQLHCAIGYTEPEAGTDLAGLKTTARLDGDEYIVTGQKIFTSGVHAADYVWLACRTGASDSKHKGISILMVDTSLPGISRTPIRALNRARQLNALYFDSVRVPASALVGEENGGWRVLTHQLNFERFNAGPAGKIVAHLDALKKWARATTIDGAPAIEHQDVRRLIAEISAIATTNKMLNWRSVADDPNRDIGPVHASVNKVFTSERLTYIARRITEIVQRLGDPAEPATAHFLEDCDHVFKTELKLPVGGGVNEIQREMIATLGLGLPRAPR